jgi:hypothetical protein
VPVIGELILELLGGGVVDLIRGDKRPNAGFPPDPIDSSLGAVSAFFGVLSLIFGSLSAFGSITDETYKDMGLGPLLTMSVLSLLGALMALRAGRRAPYVTTRNLVLARIGVVVSVAAVLASVTGLASLGIRAIS